MSPAQTIDVNIKIGLIAFDRQQYLSSLNCFDKCVSQHPECFLSRFVRGLCNYYLIELQTAETDFTICCEMENSYSDDYTRALAFYNRSIVRMRLGETEKAMADINKAISLNNFENAFYKNRALLYRRRGDFDAAQYDYETIRRQNERRKAPLKSKVLNKQKKKGIYDKLGGTTPRVRKSPVSKWPRPEARLKESIYGQVHTALACLPSQRTKEQLDTLVNESKMMRAFGDLESDINIFCDNWSIW